jgi:hypothetical protein
MPTQARSGENVAITLYWRAVSAMPESYTVFIHVLDDHDHTVAQADGLPVNADYPTDWWSSGEVIEDQHQVRLPPDAPAGEYRIAIGLYRLADLARLPIVDSAGRPQGDNQLILPDRLHIQPH